MKEYFPDTYNEITRSTMTTMLVEEDFLKKHTLFKFSPATDLHYSSYKAEHLLPPYTYLKFEN